MSVVKNRDGVVRMIKKISDYTIAKASSEDTLDIQSTAIGVVSVVKNQQITIWHHIYPYIRVLYRVLTTLTTPDKAKRSLQADLYGCNDLKTDYTRGKLTTPIPLARFLFFVSHVGTLISIHGGTV